MVLNEETARAADEALRAKAESLEGTARQMDDNRVPPNNYHPNTLAWFEESAPVLRSRAAALRQMGRDLLKEAMSA